MKKKTKRKEEYIGIAVFAVVFCIVFIGIIMVLNQHTVEEELEVEGYETTEDGAFYKRIESNNTLDDYYNDMANNTPSIYEEYNFSKESNDFIELKMQFQDGASSTLNISSDLKTNAIEFNYEISHGKTRLLMEGSSSNNYACEIITQNQVDDNTAQQFCDEAISEINQFIVKRDAFLQNKKIRELVNSPMTQYIEQE